MESLLTHLSKDAFEAARRPLLRACAKPVSSRARGLAQEVSKNSFAVLPNYWSRERCDEVKSAIDGLCARTDPIAGSWVDSRHSDHRFFRAERHLPMIQPFVDDPLIEEVRRAYTGRNRADKFALAARIDFKKDNVGSGGGWHMDSPHARQFKAILYLSDVSMDNGPFELIPGTHTRGALLQLLLKGYRKPGQYRFTEQEIARIEEATGRPRTFIGESGTLILADVTTLHRGRPIVSGTRYALTIYCGDPHLAEEI